jgi:integration host factor subunit beta
MVRSELVSRLVKRNPHLTSRAAALVVDTIFNEIAAALCRGDRVELRRFGNFSTTARPARVGRNPSTGAQVYVEDKRAPHFKPSLRMRTLPGG